MPVKQAKNSQIWFNFGEKFPKKKENPLLDIKFYAEMMDKFLHINIWWTILLFGKFQAPWGHSFQERLPYTLCKSSEKYKHADFYFVMGGQSAQLKTKSKRIYV